MKVYIEAPEESCKLEVGDRVKLKSLSTLLNNYKHEIDKGCFEFYVEEGMIYKVNPIPNQRRNRPTIGDKRAYALGKICNVAPMHFNSESGRICVYGDDFNGEISVPIFAIEYAIKGSKNA